ncbi:MAG: twitching motility protein PilJ, partial [uncultured Ramlibacter sp.]
MAVVDLLKKLFSKNAHDGAGDPSGTLSLAAPDGSMHNTIEAGSSSHAPVSSAALESMDGPETVDELELGGEGEVVSVPLLGRRTIVAHQRVLFILLAVSLVFLGSVAVFSVSQADKVAQQVRNTGDALMQSQRLAKSVSQALVGSALAFPDVRESANVLARSVRGKAQSAARISGPIVCILGKQF